VAVVAFNSFRSGRNMEGKLSHRTLSQWSYDSLMKTYDFLANYQFSLAAVLDRIYLRRLRFFLILIFIGHFD